MATAAASLDDELGRLFGSDPTLLPDPFPLYDRLVKDDPVHDFGPFLMISDYERIRKAHLEPDVLGSAVQREGSSRRELAREALPTDAHKEIFDYVAGVEERYLTQTDGPAHDRIRDISRRLFTPRRIAALEARTQEVCDALLDEMAAADGPADFARFSHELPTLIIAEMLGVPAQDAPALVEWGDMIMANMFGGQGVEALEGAGDAHRRYDRYVSAIVDRYRSGDEPTELVELMLAATGDTIVDDVQLSALFREMVLGGFETTRVLLVGTCLELLSRPDQRAKLVADPEGLAGGVVEEGLRFVTPVQWTGRIALEETEIDGIAVAPDTTVLYMLAAANRDPAVFDDPQSFEIDRPNAKSHLAFAIGKHYCLGQALARMEAKVAFETLARRFPEARPAIAPEEAEFTGQMVFRRVAALPLILGREAS
jgi:cytochrome P450